MPATVFTNCKGMGCMFLNNIKAYAVIHETERALRALICETLSTELGPDWWELVPPDITQRATQRRDDDALEAGEQVESKEEIEYTDLPDLWTILRDRHLRALFDPALKSKLTELQKSVTTLKTYRDTVMHNRVLTSVGLEDLLLASQDLGELVPQLELGSARELARIDRDEFYRKVKYGQLQAAVRLARPARELTNLPPPDFQHFVGRRTQVDAVCKRLRSKYYPIVSIDGVGGAGKSALAYAAVEMIWHAPDRPFHAAVYLSAKCARLTPQGLEVLIPSLTTYESMLDTILEVTRQQDALGLDPSGKERLVAELLAAQPVLLILDNLETATDERIYQFIKDWEYPGKILITSRRRLGELERVINLPEMQDKEAIALVRSVGKGLGLQSLAERPDQDLLPLVRKAGNIPLAVKWVLGQVALGRSLEEITKGVTARGSPVLDFCFAEIFDALSMPAKTILKCLPLFDECPTQGALVASSGLELDEFNDATQELVMASLVVPEIRFSERSVEPETVYSALPLTFAFASKELDRDQDLQRLTTERVAQFQKIQSLQERATTSLRYSLQNIGASTDLGRIAAFQALAASQVYRTGDADRAREQFRRAHETDPTVTGVLLLWAEMEDSEGNRQQADELVAQAAQLSPDDAKLWFTWGLMRKKSQQLGAAQKYLETAVQLDPSFFWSTFHLATVVSWNQNYERAWDLLKECAQLPDVLAQPSRYRAIVLAGQAECLRRWADDSLRPRTRNVNEALARLEQALEIASSLRELEPGQPSAEMLYHEVHETKGLAHFYARDFESARQCYEKALFRRPVNRKEQRRNAEVYWHFARLEIMDGEPERASSFVKLGLRTARNAVKERLLRLKDQIENGGGKVGS